MMQPKVSVIVPVYNTEIYLRRCLDSLVNQTLQEIEIIIVNDGSTDKSENILEEYKEKFPSKIKVYHKTNGGQATARNMALKEAVGEYVGFLDSDDFADVQMFEKMYRQAIMMGADYVACAYQEVTFSEDGMRILNPYVASTVAHTKEELFFGAWVSPWLHLYKREVIVENSIQFPEGLIYEDTSFYIKGIPYTDKIAIIEEPLVYHVKRKNSTVTVFKKEKVANIFPVLQDAIIFYQNNNWYNVFYEELEYFCVKILTCSSMQRISCVDSYQDACRLTFATVDFIRRNFPKYRKNKYLVKGKKNLYIKSFNKLTGLMYLTLFRILNRLKRGYV